MNRTEHLLVILMEECNELAQDTAKALRFGIDEQRDLPTSNQERMQKELNDLLGVIEMLRDEGISLTRDTVAITEKRIKVEKYLNYSRLCGTLEEQ